jgi:CO dehydrogenase maturation factor
MGKLIKDYDYVIIDNEAGLEHLSRRTTRAADTLLVISDATVVGLNAARRIRELVRELDIKTKKDLLIINQYAKNIEVDKLKSLKLEYLGSIPQDAKLEKISIQGESLMDLGDDAASIVTLRKIGEKIWHSN